MNKLFSPAPELPTELGRYRVLSSTAGIRVSLLQYGAMSIGSAWDEGMGEMDKEKSFKLLDYYFESGGNFIDTANNYQNEDSETWIGECMQARKNRDQLVIATKFTTDYKSYELEKGKTVNFCGNHKRSMHVSVRDSLAKLQTDWIDILYLHWWDWTTSIEEIMDSLHILVEQGKVLYLGIFDSPAWVVSAANTYARDHGKTPFSIYQGGWNDVLGQGKFQTAKALEERQKSGEGLRSMKGADQTEDEVRMSQALARVAAGHGPESVTAIALAYVLSKTPNVFPLVGGRKIEHLKDNLQALDIKLTPAQISYLESVQPFDAGFPTNFIGEDLKETGQPARLLASVAPLAVVRNPKPIGY
ncbi:putative aryl-alcohol dehydrogenase aad14 [Pestalotiopsis sp. IQ-011]